MIGGIQPDIPVDREEHLWAKADSLQHDLIRVSPRGCPEESAFNRARFSLVLLFSYLGDILTKYLKKIEDKKMVCLPVNPRQDILSIGEGNRSYRSFIHRNKRHKEGNHVMKKVWSVLMLCLFFAAPLSAIGEETIVPGERLTLDRCIKIALKSHPDILAASHTVRIGDSRIGQAQSNYYPQVDFQTNYGRTQAYKSGVSNLAGASPTNLYTGRLTLTQNIYDFGRTSARVGVANFDRDSFRQDLANVTSLVVLNVKQSYFYVLQSEENRRVSQETVEQFQRHLEIAKGFFEVGLKPKFDVTKAEVDLSNARLNQIKAENALRIARVTLNNAIGMPDAPEYTLENNLLFEKHEPVYQEALKAAYDNRPDLRSLLLRESAARESLNLARAGHYPTLTGNAGYGYGGSEFPLGEGWNVGGSLDIPIFSGFLVENQISESKATIDVLSANVESLKQQIRLEIDQAFSNLREATNRIDTTELTVRQARENLELAEGRYAAGVGSPIEVTDALLALSNARTSYTSALADYQNYLAALERAIGTK